MNENELRFEIRQLERKIESLERLQDYMNMWQNFKFYALSYVFFLFLILSIIKSKSH
jgi:hypothetical protein